MTIRKVLEDTSTVGRTGRATWIILKRIRDEAGFIVTDTAGYHKDLYAEKAQVRSTCMAREKDRMPQESVLMVRIGSTI